MCDGSGLSHFFIKEPNKMGKSCCFFGHRKIEHTEELKKQIYENTEKLILNENVDTFYFGSRSEFNSLCREIMKDLKEKYPNTNRIYIRAEYAYISDSYKDYLHEDYDDTYFPEKAINAGKASYVERNQIMIDKSDFCIVYYNENYLPPMRKNSRRDLFAYQPKSGTKIAYDYAEKKDKTIIRL